VESDASKIEPLSLTFGEKHEEKKESKQGIKRARINMPMNDSPIYLTTNLSKRWKQFSGMVTVSIPIEVHALAGMVSRYICITVENVMRTHAKRVREPREFILH